MQKTKPLSGIIPSRQAQFLKKYLAASVIAALLLLLGLFTWFGKQVESNIDELLLDQTRIAAREILRTRNWLETHGGLYMRQDNRISDQAADDDSAPTFTDKNAENGSRLSADSILSELSSAAESGSPFRYRITSLSPLNPRNSPDDFETDSLKQFHLGRKESSAGMDDGQDSFFRYMVPFVAEKHCLACHTNQDLDEGDILGGLSITIKATRIRQDASRAKLLLFLSMFSLLLLLAVSFLIAARQLTLRLGAAEGRLYQLITRDSLTGLLNRREGLKKLEQEMARSVRQKQPLSILLLDIDRFRSVNDDYGQDAGDRLIRMASKIIHSALREHGTVCRYGGKEFLVILPGKEERKTRILAEKLLGFIRKKELKIAENLQAKISLTCGVGQHNTGESLDDLLFKTEKNLYIAKNEERDRTRGTG